VFLGNHVAKVDPDAKLDPFFLRGSPITLGHPALDLHAAPHRVHHARELREEAVAGGLDDAAMVLGDLGFDELPEVRPQPLVRALLIRAHQPRIPRHVGS